MNSLMLFSFWNIKATSIRGWLKVEILFDIKFYHILIDSKLNVDKSISFLSSSLISRFIFIKQDTVY